jgi:two-component system sensor histidine kinase/response regulator
MKGDREKCIAGGMDGYLTKPIQPQELDQLLETYMATRDGPVSERRLSAAHC